MIFCWHCIASNSAKNQTELEQAISGRLEVAKPGLTAGLFYG